MASVASGDRDVDRQEQADLVSRATDLGDGELIGGEI